MLPLIGKAAARLFPSFFEFFIQIYFEIRLRNRVIRDPYHSPRAILEDNLTILDASDRPDEVLL
jgi:hypothetical protein